MSPSTARGSGQRSEKTRRLPCERASPLTRWFLRQPGRFPVSVLIRWMARVLLPASWLSEKNVTF